MSLQFPPPWLSGKIKGKNTAFVAKNRHKSDMADYNIHPTKYWHVASDGRVQCDVCPRACRLRDGQRGMCFVRACENGQVVLTTYGRSSGFCLDPVEKKPLNHFLPGTPILSFGTAGCNLACRYCQNWDISKSREWDTLADQATPQMIAQAALAHGCGSVAFTYNDPVVFFEYAVDVADACHELGIKAVAVTAGYMNEEPRAEFYAHIDAANIDLKGFTDRFYRDNCSGRLEPVLETLLYLKRETAVWVEITTLLIPDYNSSDQELEKLSNWIVANLGPEVPLHFTAFHPDYRMMDVLPTPAAMLTRAREIALKAGLRHVYTGNVHDPDGASTYCHSCRRRIIARDWYMLSEYQLDNQGRCSFCGAQCAGVFNGPAGKWGAKRVPVHLGQQ